MKALVMSKLVMALFLGAFGAMPAAAQHDHSSKNNPAPSAAQSKDKMSHDHMMMADEPHHVLAMAYHQNLLTFAESLRAQTDGASSVNVDFARAAVAEMRRSFDQMKEHHEDHAATMSAETRTAMTAMMQNMETHQAELDTQLTALEKEVKMTAPDAAKVSALAASVPAHLDAMMEKKPGHPKGKM